jgi:hypothetical protein
MRFNYITSAGLDSGLAISTIVVVLTLSLTNTPMTNWWGSDKALATMDSTDTAFLKLVPEGGTFGPKTW